MIIDVVQLRTGHYIIIIGILSVVRDYTIVKNTTGNKVFGSGFTVDEC
jgi:translation elongation factor P/translation initiation factor 5A